MNWKLNLIWLLYITSYKNYTEQKIANGDEVIFEISRYEGPKCKKVYVATYNKYTGIYKFNSYRFLNLNDMLDYVIIRF